MFEETPIWTLVRILFMQAVGMQAYFAYNALGNKELYPNYTNVRNRSSPNTQGFMGILTSFDFMLALFAEFRTVQEGAKEGNHHV